MSGANDDRIGWVLVGVLVLVNVILVAIFVATVFGLWSL